MAIKCTGAEYKSFMAADWGNNVYMDDYCISVNGEEFIGCDLDEDNIEPTDKVVIMAGCVYDDASYLRTLEAHFKMWRKKQTTAIVVVECPHDKLETVKAAIIAAGGKVK